MDGVIRSRWSPGRTRAYNVRNASENEDSTTEDTEDRRKNPVVFSPVDEPQDVLNDVEGQD
jgi:hypothetical protein